MWEGTYRVIDLSRGCAERSTKKSSHPVLRSACAIELERGKEIRDK